MDPRFGRTEYLVVFDQETGQLEVVDNREVKQEAHGAGTATAQKLFALRPDVLVTGNGPGGNAAAALGHLKIKIFTGAQGMTLREAYEQYTAGKLPEF